MKYKELIDKKFEKFKLIPRKGQVETINQILTEYRDNKKRHVVLSGSTGSGKSIIAVIVSECLYELNPSPQDRLMYDKARSYILMHTNTLTKQYRETFEKYKDFLVIKGAANYECPIVRDTAESCMLKNVKKTLKPKIMPKACNTCEFRKTRMEMITTPHFITNYAYYFVSSLYTKGMQGRLIAIYDEAHLLNDLFAGQLELNITTKRIQYLMKILKDLKINETDSGMKSLSQFATQIRAKKVNNVNYRNFLQRFFELISSLGQSYDEKAMSFYSMQRNDEYKKYLKASKLFSRLNKKYKLFVDHNYENVVEIDNTKISLKPIFIKKMFELLERTKYNLFMSATINKEYISKTLDIPLDEIAFVKPPPAFPPESKEVIFVNHLAYNYKAMSDKTVLNDMGKIIADIVEKHSNDSGIILTPSFFINEYIANALKKYRGLSNIQIIEQKRGEHLSGPLQKHKDSKKTSILISPSLFEGIDLPNEQSRWQIFVKAPYASLADKRIKEILNKYPEIYRINTLFKIIQGFGRSTRHESDHSVTYCLDNHIHTLYNSSTNKWKDEFKIIKL